MALVYGQSASINVPANPAIHSYRNVSQQEGGTVPPQITNVQNPSGYYGYDGRYNPAGVTPSYYYGSSQNAPNPYLAYSRDIQNLYRRKQNLGLD